MKIIVMALSALLCVATFGARAWAQSSPPVRISLSEHMRMQVLWDAAIKPCLANAQDSQPHHVTLRIKLNEDGTLAERPVILNETDQATGAAALRAIVRCVTTASPLRFNPAFYGAWKTFDATVTPRNLAP